MVNAPTANGQHVGRLGKNIGLNDFLDLWDLKPDLLVSRGFPICGEEPQGVRRVENITCQALDFVLVNKIVPTAGVSQPLPDSRSNDRARDSIGQAFATVHT